MSSNVKKGKKDFFTHLNYKNQYKSFDDFYDENKEEIYLSIIDLFVAFQKSRKKMLALRLTAKISDMIWDTEFKFSKKEYFVLKRDIMPFFEQNENYEVCSKIIELDKQLTN